MKVSIVGASIAGLTCAAHLAKYSTADIYVYERKPHVGDVVCGEAVSKWGLEWSAVSLPPFCVARKLRGAVIWSGTKKAILESKNHLGYSIDRSLCEKLLAQEAESRGAKFVFNAKLKTPPKADYIVGADGIMGITRTWCSLPLPAKHDLHLGVQVLAKPLEEPELVQLFFGRCAPGGYAWVFPDPREDLAKVGLGVPLSCPENAGALLKLFIRRHKFKPKTKMSCKLIPTAPPLNRYVFSNILLTGDAAQATDPSTGGGIPAALLSGQLAASCIAQRRPDLYQKLMVKKVNTRNRIRYAIKEALFALTDREYELLVDGIKSVTPSDNFSFSVVEAIGRILMSHPRLITKTKLLRRIAKAYFAGG